MNNNTVITSPPVKRKRRVFPWIFLAAQALFVVWLAVGIGGQGHAHCNGLNAHDCAAATDTGNAIGIGLIIGLWVAFDIIAGGTYLVFRLARRGRS